MASTSPDSDALAISLNDVSKCYGALTVVDGVSLDVPRGEILGLIGHNGAGKSTVFKMMLDLTRATRGDIRVANASVTGSDFRAARRQIGYLPENVVLYDNLDGLETLSFFARLKGTSLTECPAMLVRVGLGHAGRRPVRAYSTGMRQRLGFAQALLGSPRVLFLDEPTNGLDPGAIRDFYATLRTLQSEGVTVVITSHILSELQERVDRLAILASGRLQAVGSVQSLRERTHLPLTVELEIDAVDAPAVSHALLNATGISADETPAGLSIECPQGQKMAVIAALAPFAARVRNLEILEPSLEDLFFGLEDSSPR